jgi:hypothetical protein
MMAQAVKSSCLEREQQNRIPVLRPVVLSIIEEPMNFAPDRSHSPGQAPGHVWRIMR